jgi:hypothetical protein
MGSRYGLFLLGCNWVQLVHPHLFGWVQIDLWNLHLSFLPLCVSQMLKRYTELWSDGDPAASTRVTGIATARGGICFAPLHIKIEKIEPYQCRA